jgi:serpin B
MNRVCLAAALVVVFARAALTAEPAPMEITADVKAVAQSNNEFATALYGHLRTDKPSNLFLSPYSISTALAMVEVGAKGDTATEMIKVLRLSLPESKLFPAIDTQRKLLVSSAETPDFQLHVANRLWGQKGVTFLPRFLQILGSDFGADLGPLDFRQTETARTTINAWIDAQTNHKIQDLLAPGVLSADTRLVLTNAIYFKARWQEVFEKSATADAAFQTTASDHVSVPTMHETQHFFYAATDHLQVLELPYNGGVTSMLILLPKKVDGLGELEKQLTAENLKGWTSNLQSRRVKVSLPRFKLTSEFSLGETLASLGMPLAFSSKADFTRMSAEEKLSISAVIHKAFVDVNEEGTEAAAATAVAITALAIPVREEAVEFRADHPFLFLIRDNRTQSILFLGSLANPKP